MLEALKKFAEDEGQESAIHTAERLRNSLEIMVEFANAVEREHISPLLTTINEALSVLVMEKVR